MLAWFAALVLLIVAHTAFVVLVLTYNGPIARWMDRLTIRLRAARLKREAEAHKARLWPSWRKTI